MLSFSRAVLTRWVRVSPSRPEMWSNELACESLAPAPRPTYQQHEWSPLKRRCERSTGRESNPSTYQFQLCYTDPVRSDSGPQRLQIAPVPSGRVSCIARFCWDQLLECPVVLHRLHHLCFTSSSRAARFTAGAALPASASSGKRFITSRWGASAPH